MNIDDWVVEWEKRVPKELQEDWDNTGKQLGNFSQELSGIVFSLDLTQKAIDLAKDKKANLILTHHPIFFNGIKSLLIEDPLNAMIIECIKSDLSVYSSHTAFDAVDGGVNDCIAEILGLEDCQALDSQYINTFFSEYSKGMGRIGNLESEINLEDFAKLVNEKFNAGGVTVYGELDRKIKRVAVLGGSGMSYMNHAIKKGADVFITGDIKYHDAQKALRKGLYLIDLGHYASEVPSMDKAKKIAEEISSDISYFISKDSWDCMRKTV